MHLLLSLSGCSVCSSHSEDPEMGALVPVSCVLMTVPLLAWCWRVWQNIKSLAHICFLSNLTVLPISFWHVPVTKAHLTLFPLLVTYSFTQRIFFFSLDPIDCTEMCLCWSFWVSLSRDRACYFIMWFQAFFLSFKEKFLLNYTWHLFCSLACLTVLLPGPSVTHMC